MASRCFFTRKSYCIIFQRANDAQPKDNPFATAEETQLVPVLPLSLSAFMQAHALYTIVNDAMIIKA